MKRMNLLFIGGRRGGKTTFVTRTLREAFTNVPSWLNLRFSLQGTAIPGALEGNLQALARGVAPGPMHAAADFEVCRVRVRKKRIFWFSVVMDLLRRIFLWKPMTEVGGVLIHVYEMSVENPHLGQWLLDHSAPQTPLGVVLIADPFAVGKTCESRHEPTVSAVVDRLVERFEQIYVSNPEKRLPVSAAVVVTKAESFPQFQTGFRRYVDSTTLLASRRALGDADEMLPDSYLLDGLLKRQSEEVEEELDRYDGNFTNILQNEFRRVGCFWSGNASESEPKGDFCRMTSPILPLLWLLGEEMEF